VGWNDDEKKMGRKLKIFRQTRCYQNIRNQMNIFSVSVVYRRSGLLRPVDVNKDMDFDLTRRIGSSRVLCQKEPAPPQLIAAVP